MTDTAANASRMPVGASSFSPSLASVDAATSAATRRQGAATLLGAGRCLVVSAAELERSRRERLVEVERRREDATVEPTADQHVDQGGLDGLDLVAIACSPTGCTFKYRQRHQRRVTGHAGCE